jgi:hypothetical protein
MKTLEQRAITALHELLNDVPIVQLDRETTSWLSGSLLHIKAAGKSHTLLCEFKANGQPRFVEDSILRLRHQLRLMASNTTPVVLAPFLSLAARALCRENNIAYVDLEGNAWIAFKGIYIDHKVTDRPIATRRVLKSLFQPQSAQIIRTMLRDPQRSWRVTELAHITGVSLGHVSNVRTALIDQEWAQVTRDGVFLSAPHALLDAWSQAYEPLVGEQKRFYTALHGPAFEAAARQAFEHTAAGRAVFCSYSAAHWLAPYARITTHYFYADEAGMQTLINNLHLTPIAKGESVVITLPSDERLLLDVVEPATGVRCSNPIQTYLDLSVAGERGKEAAEHLRQELLQWPN